MTIKHPLLHSYYEAINTNRVCVVDVCPWGNTEDNTYYINRIFVPEAHRNQGHGTRIMSRLTKDADSANVKLCVYPTENYGSDLTRLTRLLHRFGFTITDNDLFMIREPNQPKQYRSY